MKAFLVVYNSIKIYSNVRFANVLLVLISCPDLGGAENKKGCPGPSLISIFFKAQSSYIKLIVVTYLKLKTRRSSQFLIQFKNGHLFEDFAH